MLDLSRDVVHTAHAPAAAGPYSQAIIANGLVFVAGQIGLDPLQGRLAQGIEAQTHRVLENIKAILVSARSDLDLVVKTTVYLTSMEDFVVMNGIYGGYFPSDPPARTTVIVAELPLGASIEIEVIAFAVAEA